MSEILLNKETLHAMATSPTFKRFQFLAPLRLKMAVKPSKTCAGCPKASAMGYLSDPVQEATLQSLVPGGVFSGEVLALKKACDADTLILPTQRGQIRL